MDFFNKDGHLNATGISLYADAVKFGKVQELPKEVSAHIVDCDKCQYEMIELTSIMTEVDQTGVGEHPYFKTGEKEVSHDSKPLTLQWIFRIAVAAVIGLLLLFSYQRYFQKEASEEIVDTEIREESAKEENNSIQKDPIFVEEDNSVKEETQAPTQKEEVPGPKEDEQERPESQYLANYIPNEELESMVGTVFRSGAIVVTGPENNAGFKIAEEIVFNWDMEDIAKLSIYDNEENVVFERDLVNSPIKLKSEFDPGIYYWKIETEQDLVHLGKFIIVEE